MTVVPVAITNFTAAVAVSLAVTWILRRYAPALGLVDDPDGTRKLHADRMPTGGGVAIYLTVALVIGSGLLRGLPALDLSGGRVQEAAALATGATAIFLLGLVDDRYHLRAWTKFGVQTVIAVGMFLAGVEISRLTLGGVGVDLAVWVSLPLTVLWLVGITNSFNLIDGSDGVAGGAALFALFTFAVVSLIVGTDYAVVLSLILAGATLGFLVFNFPPATIYLGDAGSQFLGFSLAALAIVATQKSSTAVAVAVPILSFGVPILDTSLAIFRRTLRGQSIFKADRGHIHHRLAELGHSPRMIAFGVWGLSATFGLLSLLLLGGAGTEVAAVLIAAGVVVFFVVQRLRLPELQSRIPLVPGVGPVAGGARRRSGWVPIRTMTDDVRAASNVPQVLRALTHGFSNGQFTELELRLNGPSGRALISVLGSRRDGPEVVWRSHLSEHDGPSWESRFPILDEAGLPRGVMVLHHATSYEGNRMDLGQIQTWLLPEFVRVMEDLVSQVPRDDQELSIAMGSTGARARALGHSDTR